MPNPKQTATEWLLTQLVNNDIISQEQLLDKSSDIYFICESALKINILQIKQSFYDGRNWNMSWNEDTYYQEVYEKNGRYL